MHAIALSLTPCPTPSYKPSLTLLAAPAPCLSDMFRVHRAYVHRHLRRLGVASAAVDDAAQDVFVVAHRHLHKFRAGTSERAWLSAIALRVASDYRRAAKRRPTSSLDEVAPSAREASPLDTAIRRETLTCVHLALQSLSDVQREVFMLADVEELTAPEIAERTETKLATVYTRMLAARKRFNEALRPQATDA